MNTKAIVNSLTIETRRQGNCQFHFNTDIFDSINSNYFNPAYWQKHQLVTGTAQGRGTTWFVKHQSHELVLRHYYRGGLVGKLLKDGYLYTGEKNTRPYQEFNLLVKMHSLGLPVPEPAAFRVEKNRLHYTADIITRRIANAQDLVGILSERAIEQSLWETIGTVIKDFHRAGINHHDLNCHNILIDDQQKVWIIDFDQGKHMGANGNWQQSNLDRLKRSFIKEKNRLATFEWQAQDWQFLTNGYQK